MSNVSLIDVVAAYYASIGEIEAKSLGPRPFSEVLPILHGVQQNYPELIAISAKRRAACGPICHMACHINDMIEWEKRNG